MKDMNCRCEAIIANVPEHLRDLATWLCHPCAIKQEKSAPLQTLMARKTTCRCGNNIEDIIAKLTLNPVCGKRKPIQCDECAAKAKVGRIAKRDADDVECEIYGASPNRYVERVERAARIAKMAA